MDDHETRLFRRLVERPERCRFWGQPYTITPRLIGRIFGDGKHLICITPLATRPNYFVVRVDSGPAFDIHDILNSAIDAAEEEFGYFGDEDELDASGDDPRPFPVTDWGIGVCWGERFPIADWVPTPRPKRGRVQPQPRKGSIL